MSERVVKVRLSAQVAEYQKGMLDAAKATRDVGSEAEKLAQKKEAFNLLGTAGLAAGTAMVAGSVLAVKAAMDWESAWAGVTKTVDGSPEQLGAIEDGLRGLTSVLPASHEEIAAVAEAAGQLGIQTPNVVAFTKTMIDMGESTNLSAEDAATSLARFMNIMGTSQDKVSNLGSAIVGLGNNYATTEAEIMEMAMRLAGAGKQVGLSEGQVLGLSTALSSVGIEAEAGGSAVSKVLIDIAANADKGGAKFEKYASTAGMTADQFKKLWQSSPADALSAFVKGLANAEKQGSSTLGVLADLDITEVRMRDALLRSSAAADMFSGAMKMGSKEFEKNNALTAEAEKRYATVESRIRMAGNSINDAAISFGQTLLPIVADGTEGVAKFAQGLADLPEPVQGILAIVTGLGGAALTAAGLFLLGVPKVAEYRAALETMGLGAQRANRFVAGLGRTVGALAVFAIATTAVTEFGDAMADKIGPSAEEVSSKVTLAKSGVEQFYAALQKRDAPVHSVKDAVPLFEQVGDALDIAKRKADNFWTGVSGQQQDTLNTIYTLGEELGKIAQTDFGTASRQFARFAKDAGLTKEQTTQALREMPAFRDALIRQAKAAGVASDDQSLLNYVMEQAAPAATSASDAYLDQVDAAKDLSDQLAELIDKINEANGVNQDAVSANASYQEGLAGIAEEVDRQKKAYEELNGTTDGFVASLNEGTAAGASNASMLSDVARQAQDAAAAQFEVDKKTMSAKDAADKYASTLAAQRQAFIDSAVAAGFSRDEVVKLADRVFALPTAREMEILANTTQAQNAISALVNEQYIAWIDVRATMPDLNGSASGGGRPGLANGGIVEGGELAFASGGFAPGIYPYKPGGRIKFAEEYEEAYISMNPARRERSLDVWYETGRRLGTVGEAGGASAVALQLDGMTITGRLEIGGDGLARIIDGRVVAHAASNAVTLAGGRASR